MIRDIALAPGVVPGAPTDDELVYHYTTVKGLLGIIVDKKIWATDVWFMNDAMEGQYALGVTREFLRDKYNSTSGSAQLIAEVALEQTEHIPLGPDNNARSYIACFSRMADQLSQWRAYGSSRGFSVGFRRGALEALASELPPPADAKLREVVYDPGTQDGLLADAFNQTTTTFRLSTQNKLGALTPAMSFIAEAGMLAPTFKHAAFAEESEVRLHLYQYSADTAANLEFRDSEMGLTPYLSLPLISPKIGISDVIKEVIIGPQANHAEALRAVNQLLSRNDLDGDIARLSTVPLRR